MEKTARTQRGPLANSFAQIVLLISPLPPSNDELSGPDVELQDPLTAGPVEYGADTIRQKEVVPSSAKDLERWRVAAR